MSRQAIRRGGPLRDPTVNPVRSGPSPWWDSVTSEVGGPAGLVGTLLTIEELTERIPCYPDGRRPRTRTVARRLRSILELVSAGPNGSRSVGATYRVMAYVPPPSYVSDEGMAIDEDWLAAAADRMTGGGRMGKT